MFIADNFRSTFSPMITSVFSPWRLTLDVDVEHGLGVEVRVSVGAGVVCEGVVADWGGAV